MVGAENSRRRTRSSRTAATEESVAEPAKVETSNSSKPPEAPATEATTSSTPEEKVTKTDTAKEISALAVAKEKAEIQASPSGSIWNRPIGPGQIEVLENISVAGVRPIAASHMEVYGTILNDRPIMASHIQVSDTTIPGGRPIFTSDIVVCEDLMLPGGRPVFASDVRLMDAPLLPGGRPIADNDTEDSEMMMGYLD